MADPFLTPRNFAELERAVQEICEKIDQLALHIPEEDRAYAQVAKDSLWRMYRNAYQRELAREGL